MAHISDKVSRTVGEYRFIPGYTREGVSKDTISVKALLTKPCHSRPQIFLNLPVMSAAMQSVTGSGLGIALAQLGGVGVIYCSQPIDEEARMVREVKRAKAGFVTELEVVGPDTSVDDVIRLIEETGYNTIPVVEGDREKYGRLLGIIEGSTLEDLPPNMPAHQAMLEFRMESREEMSARAKREASDSDLSRVIGEYVDYGIAGISLREAVEIMKGPGGQKKPQEKKYLPIVNPDGTLKAMVFMKDALASKEFPNAVVDEDKRYLAAAAFNTRDHEERIPALVDAGVDVLFLDTSDAYSHWVDKCLTFARGEFPAMPIIAGNIVSREAFEHLVKHDIDGIKVGMGSGSICITTDEKGAGRGLATAIIEVAAARDAYQMKGHPYVPIIADGGIKLGKDITMALALGADSIMMGSYFAPCEESCAPRDSRDGRTYVWYWGEGSTRAKAWRGARYNQNDFDEGVESRLIAEGPVEEKLRSTFSRVYATMEGQGAANMTELRDSRVELISDAAMAQASPHGVIVDSQQDK